MMKVWEVYIDDGFVGTIRGETVQQAREEAIRFYNIQADQLVTIKPDKG